MPDSEFYIVGCWILLYSFKYFRTLFWQAEKLLGICLTQLRFAFKLCFGLSRVVFRLRVWRYTSEDSIYCPQYYKIFPIWLVGQKTFLVLGELWELFDYLAHCFLVVLYPTLWCMTPCMHRSVLSKRFKEALPPLRYSVPQILDAFTLPDSDLYFLNLLRWQGSVYAFPPCAEAWKLFQAGN